MTPGALGLAGGTGRSRFAPATPYLRSAKGRNPEVVVRTCPSCGEEWAATVPVCTCGTNLAGDGRQGGRWRPSRGLILTILAVVAVVPGAIAVTMYLLPDGAMAPGGVDVPDRGREALPDELPDRRARPTVTCEGIGVADNCMVWTFTLPRDSSLNVATATGDDAVLVRDAQKLWLLDLATGEERWHREQADNGDDVHEVWLVGNRAIVASPTGFDVFDAATGEHLVTRRPVDQLIRVGADDQHVVTATTRDDRVIVTAWDPDGAEPLWESTIDIDRPVMDVSFPVAGPVFGLPDEMLLVSFAIRVSSDAVEHHRVIFDRETGERHEDRPEPDNLDEPGLFSGTWVMLEGAELRGVVPPDTVIWERQLPSPFVHVQPLAGERAALTPQDFSRITIIDAATGNELFDIRGNGSRLHELSLHSPWVVTVRTADAQHVVLLDLP